MRSRLLVTKIGFEGLFLDYFPFNSNFLKNFALFAKFLANLFHKTIKNY